MPAPDPQVSVFHFTSRISSAKIRKYKLATERGMSSGNGNGRTPTPGPSNSKPTPSPSLGPSSMDPPPPKKQKLKLNVRRPSQTSQSQSPDTIAVARPRRESTLQIQYDENMKINDEDTENSIRLQQPRPSPAASSDLSSLSSLPSAEKEPTSAAETGKTSKKSRGYGQDFMSYYVEGGEEEGEDDEPPAPRSMPTVSRKSTNKPEGGNHALSVQPPPQPKEPKFKNHSGPQPYPMSKLPVMPPPQSRAPPPLPQPTVQLIDTIKRAPATKPPDTVSSMIKKLQALSSALATFGGVPPPKDDIGGSKSSEGATEAVTDKANTSTDPDKKNNVEPTRSAKGKENAVDDLLAMFDEDDDDDDDDNDDDDNEDATEGEKGNDQAVSSVLNSPLQNPGKVDDALHYGIQFIQNALKSWAQTRLHTMYTQQYLQAHQHAQNEAQQHQRRGPGRPSRLDEEEKARRTSLPPSVIQVELSRTPEGAAIAAFQEVLDSGCLQVNAILPVELSRALRNLYRQIDQLINQGARNEAPWQCVSYGAQIEAQRARVEQWNESHAKAQQEMARQHQLSQEQLLQQMGISPQTRTSMSTEQAQQAHAIELERRRSYQHAAQQPHLRNSISNPMALNSQSAVKVPTSAHPLSRVSSADPTSPDDSTDTVQTQQSATDGLSSQASQADPKGVQLDRIKLYMPNYLPRSGQSMKFSFAPNNELAVKAFGAQAFPTTNPGPNLPNRGPMTAGTSTSAAMPSTRQSNGTGPSLSFTMTPNTPASPRTTAELIEAANRNVGRRMSQQQPGRPRLSYTNGSASVKSSPTQGTGFSDAGAGGATKSSPAPPTASALASPLGSNATLKEALAKLQASKLANGVAPKSASPNQGSDVAMSE